MIAPISMSVADNIATVTDGNGYTYTARDIRIEPGDELAVENYGAGWYFVVRRDAEEVQRVPLRGSAGWHYEDFTTFMLPPNPFVGTEVINEDLSVDARLAMIRELMGYTCGFRFEESRADE